MGQPAQTPPLEIARLVVEAQREEEERIPSTLAQLTQAVLDDNDELAEFHAIRGKALRSRAEQRRYHELLADLSMIESAKEDLLDAAGSDEPLDQEEEIERLVQLKYLRSALDWKENPHRGEVLTAIVEVLFADAPEGPKDRRGSVLGDKVDLYQHLLISDPDEARRVRQDAVGSELAALFLHAEMMLSSPEEAAQNVP